MEYGEYLIIIEQSGFQQRIIYDNAIKQHKTSGKSSAVQDLLFPLDVQLNASQLQILKNLRNDIESIGFRYDLSENEAVFSGLPVTIRHGKEEESLRRFIAELSTLDNLSLTDIFDKICSSYSESVAVRNGTELNEIEIREMFSSLKNYKLPVYSPKGKKSVIKLTSQEFFNKLFFN
jgi:DNA mismatch repair protein MutL